MAERNSNLDCWIVQTPINKAYYLAHKSCNYFCEDTMQLYFIIKSSFEANKSEEKF